MQYNADPDLDPGPCTSRGSGGDKQRKKDKLLKICPLNLSQMWRQTVENSRMTTQFAKFEKMFFGNIWNTIFKLTAQELVDQKWQKLEATALMVNMRKKN